MLAGPAVGSKEENVPRRWFSLLLTVVAVLVFVACTDRQPATAIAAPPAAAPAAPTAAPAVTDYYETSGPLVVENQVDVTAQRDGMVARILVDTGTPVRKGELLAQLDDRQLTADRDAADAKMRAIEADEKHWEEEEKVIQNDLARDEEMFKAQLITEKQVQHSRYKVVSYKFEIQREQQNLRNAQATLRSLQLELEKTRILAPFSGVVARRYVRAGQKVATNDRLFWVTATAPVLVHFTLPQLFVGRIQRGDDIAVLASSAAAQHRARVTSVSPVVDPSSGTIEVHAELMGATPDLHPGMTANVRVKKAQ
jgi:membrane fusion protein, multidrug efflux system